MIIDPNDTRRPHRTWVGHCRYPGKKPFYLGTVALPVDATNQEASEALKQLWDDISPFPAPEFVDVTPGYMVFLPEGQVIPTKRAA